MGNASGVISSLQTSANCSGSCSCCTALESRVAALESQVAGLLSSIEAIKQSLAALQEFISSEIAKVTETINALIVSADKRLSELQTLIVQSIAALRDFLLNLISGNNSSLEARVSDLERRVGNFGVQLQDAAASIASLTSRVASLENWKSSIETQVNSLSNLVQALNGRVQSIDNQIAALQESVSSLATLINTKFNELVTAINTLSTELRNLINSYQQYLLERIATIENALAKIAASLDREIQAIRTFITSELSKLTDLLYAQIKALTELIYSLLSGNNSGGDYDYLLQRLVIAERAIDSINSRLESLTNSVSTIRQQVTSLATQISDILSRLKNYSSDTLNMSEIRSLFSQVLSAISAIDTGSSSTGQTSTLNNIYSAVNNNIQLTSKVLTKLEVDISGDTVQSDCKNGTNNTTIPYSGKGFSGLSDQINSLNNALSVKLCNLQSTDDSTEEKAANKTITKIYRILGGDTWFDSSDQIRIYHDPEKQIRAAGKVQYNANGETSKNTESTSLIDWIQNMLAPQYYRAGYQELPGEVPETLLSIGSDKDRKILNALDLQQWLIEQLDALIGQFPLEIEIKDADPLKAGDQPKKLELANLSEVLAELVGLNFLQTQNSDILINYVNRLAVETIATKNAAIIAQDYAKANASYLGYNANPVEREIVYAINVFGDSLETVLAETKGKLIGWANTDKNSVTDYLKRIFFTVGILKESNFIRPKNAQRLIDSLGMVKTQEQSEASTKLTSDIATMNDPSSTFNSPRKEDTSLPEVLVKVKKKT
jgi:predicted  nucleic acid-binding Zn-ribbon protein